MPTHLDPRDDRMTSYIVEADGGSRGNPGPAAYGAVVVDAESGRVLLEVAEYIGEATNNVAEYRGAMAGLHAVRELNPDAKVEVRLDSKLVVEQMSGRWKIKHPQMRELALQVRNIMPMDQVSFVWVPRATNTRADALVNEVLDSALQDGAAAIRRESLEDLADDVQGEAEEAHTQALLEEKRPANQLIGWVDIGKPTVTLLARHGATQYSLEKKFSGSGGVDVPLADLGRTQADALAFELSVRGGIDRIVASPLLRAQQTAEIVGGALQLPYEVDEDLRECDFGLWDGHTFAEVQKLWPDHVGEWLASSDVPPPGGESLDQCASRIDDARRRIIATYPGETVLVVAHVTPIKVLVTKALGAVIETIYRMELAPCSITTLAWYPDGNASMFGFSDIAHLRDVPSPHGT
jgi:broad specificity phosphatase PhoE/ribonuclease HI